MEHKDLLDNHIYGDPGVGESGSGLKYNQVIEAIDEDEVGLKEFDAIVNGYMKGTDSGKAHTMLGLMSSEWTIERLQGWGLVTTELRSCNFSSLRTSSAGLIYEMYYNLLEDANFVQLNDDPALFREIDLYYTQQPVYFQYNFLTGRSIYLISVVDNARAIEPVKDAHDLRLPCEKVHPFAFHLRLVEKAAKFRTHSIETIFKSFLPLEESLLFDESRNDTDPQEIRKQLQVLHNHLRWMIIYEQYNDRDQSRVNILIRELARFREVIKGKAEYVPVDEMQHDRIRDGFLCFQDFCHDRSMRLRNRRERVQNLISLLYNLMQNRDSTTNIKIASASANIAQESKRDSAAMKTIAILTTLFLPATFVAALFSANIFSFALIPENAWRIYLAVTLPLTAITLGGWTTWIQWRERRRKQQIKDEEKIE